MRNASCLDCKERYVGCHIVCTKYLEFVKKTEEVKEKRKKDYSKVNTKSYSDNIKRKIMRKK